MLSEMRQKDFIDWWCDLQMRAGTNSNAPTSEMVWEFIQSHQQPFDRVAVDKIEDLVTEFYMAVDSAAREGRILINDPCVGLVTEIECLIIDRENCEDRCIKPECGTCGGSGEACGLQLDCCTHPSQKAQGRCERCPEWGACPDCKPECGHGVLNKRDGVTKCGYCRVVIYCRGRGVVQYVADERVEQQRKGRERRQSKTERLQGTTTEMRNVEKPTWAEYMSITVIAILIIVWMA